MITTHKHRLTRLAGLTAIALSVFAAPPANAEPVLTRTELQRLPAPAAGFEIVQTRSEIPVGVESGMHSHPGPEIGYILQGNVDIVFGDVTDSEQIVRFQQGDPVHIPPGSVHNVVNVGTVPVLMLSTYVIDAYQPLVTPR
jgi:quercetin dioxygenase-like cupin family protein